MIGHKSVIALVLILVTGWAQADWVTPAERVREGISLRAEPSSQSAYLGQLQVGERLAYRSTVPYWYEVVLPNGQPAFVSKAWSTLIPAETNTTTMGPFTLDAIDVGTGLAILVQGPDFALLYDGGSNDDLARGDNNRLLAFLRAAYPNLTRLDHVILSHPHRDHVELLPDVMAAYAIGDVWDAGAINDICGYRAFIDAVVTHNLTYHSARYNHGAHTLHFPNDSGACYGQPRTVRDIALHHGHDIDEQTIDLGANAQMHFLHASAYPYPDVNRNSLVVRLDLGQHRVLLMGDAEAGARAQWSSGVPETGSIEGMLLACCAAQLHADVLVAGHHGSRTSSRRTFLDAVQASTFIIPSGPKKYGSVRLPDQVVVDALSARGDVYRTDRDDLACATDSSKIGPDADNKPGGCDNIRVTLSNNINTQYLDLHD